jgi:hypothetical protein
MARTGRPAKRLLPLRRCALAACVLFDVDLIPADDGVLLPGTPVVFVSWDECRLALRGARSQTPRARRLLAGWLRMRRMLADRPTLELAERVRPLALPVEHALHPGPDWPRTRVLGGCLDVGVALVGIDPRRPDDVVPLPHALAVAAGLPDDAWWPDAVGYLERMGAMAVSRHVREPRVPIRPMGDCDVITLLASRTFRAAIVAGDGMRAMAAPMRSRGWLDLMRIDPAFVAAAAMATEPEQRAFVRPLLVTAEEVALALEGGDPAQIVLRDPAAAEPVRPPMYFS